MPKIFFFCIKVNLDSAKTINNPSLSIRSNFLTKHRVDTGSVVNTFVKLCLRAIDRYNRENGASSPMRNYPRSVKELTDLTENVYKNGRPQAQALAAASMKTVQEVVDVVSLSLSNQESNNRDASDTATLKMWTEIYIRWNKTYPDTFWDTLTPVKAPTLVTDGTTGRNTVSQNNPNTFILSAESSEKGYAGQFKKRPEILSTPLMPNATEVSLT